MYQSCQNHTLCLMNSLNCKLVLFGLHLTFGVSGYVIEGSRAKEKIHWGDSMLWQTGTAGINKTLTSAVM